jgi:hypothetical protein
MAILRPNRRREQIVTDISASARQSGSAAFLLWPAEPPDRRHFCSPSRELATAASFSRLGARSRWKDLFPIGLHVDNRPAIYRCSVQCLVQLADVRMAVIGIFALCVGMMHDEAQTTSATKSQARSVTRQSRPLQHFKIAIRIPKGGDRTAPDVRMDANRLASLVVDEVDLG